MKQSLPDLVKTHLRQASGIPSDVNGYVSRLADNLLPGVRLDHFESDLGQGGGHELNKKFLALHSSAALAINTFAPFKDTPSSLSILRKQGFGPPVFERQLPTGLRGTPPNIDVYLQSDEEVIAIESKFLEYCTPKLANYSDSYSKDTLPLVEDCWWRVLEESKAAGLKYLDVAQLVKHYLGLIRLADRGKEGEKEKEITLLYLFWEPTNADEIEECRSHRQEIEDLTFKVTDSTIKFRALSYPELWRQWESVSEIAGHVANLRARYSLTLQLP